jgi:hypothetical protein
MPRTNLARYRDPVRGTRTIKETARLFGCGHAKITSMIKNGVLKAVLVGCRQQPTVSSIEENLGAPIEHLERHLTADAEG